MKIMIVDDEEIQRITIRDDLVDMGYNVVAQASAERALKTLETFKPDLDNHRFKNAGHRRSGIS